GPRFDREVQATLRGGSVFYFKGRIRRPDGELRWVEFDGKRSRSGKGGAVVLVGTAKNITGREVAEEALRIERGRLAIALTAGQMGVYDWSLKDDSIWWSPETYAVFGVTESGFSPTREALRALVHPDDRQGLWEHLQNCVRNREPFGCEFRIRHPDGGVRWIGNRARIEYDALGAALRCSGVAIDITRQKEIEEALIESRRIAEAANQAKDRFLAVLSHELRTPLTPVLMAVDELEHEETLAPEVRGELAMISRNIRLEIKLIDDLLDLSRITSGKVDLKKEPVDLNRVMLDVCAICRSQIQEKSLKLEFTPGGEDCVIPADAARLHQVLWNLLRNAVKFTPAHGTIRVSVLRDGTDRCVVRVADDGIGIPAEALPRIFNAFEQGEAHITRQFGGLGLGLAISRALVELHGGSIRAESGGTDQGAVFVLELPTGEIGAPPVQSVPVAGAAGPAGRLRVLLVEDHADTARTLRRLLTLRGFEIAGAADVAGAILLAGREEFDLIISDLGLPDGSGCDLMRALRAAGNAVPGIAMSGYGMEEDMKRSAEAGFARHLVKPVGISRLMEAIQELMSGQSGPGESGVGGVQ
ncbi:MAG: sensor hybrid histidine kinase, partial [Verrucomicrobiales bacterium]|nr:sensor hybrid histidine kinase [Verrucomicrobiales bacterium]